MENTQQTNLSINESVKALTEMGYTSFSKRIVNHSEFADNCKLTYWSSVALNASTNGQIDYNKWNADKPILEDDSCVEIMNVAEFLNNLSSDILQISVRFLEDKQVLTCFTECLSKRSIYAWDNNLYITHVTDNYDSEDKDGWLCNIAKYNLRTDVWYPVNVITHSPWYNRASNENKILPVNYVCLGIDQAPEMISIGKELLPQMDDIKNVSTTPEMLLNDDIKPFADHYNNQMQNELYQFNSNNKTGWLSVAIAGFIFSRSLLIMSIDKHGKRRYYSIS